MDLGLHLELVHPAELLCSKQSLGLGQNINEFVDCVLSTVYNALRDFKKIPEKEAQRRKLVFSSFVPDICAALNWKQPNCKLTWMYVAEATLTNEY